MDFVTFSSTITSFANMGGLFYFLWWICYLISSDILKLVFKIFFLIPPFLKTKLSSRLYDSLKNKNNVMLGVLVSGPTRHQFQPARRNRGWAPGVPLCVRQKHQGSGVRRKPLRVPAGGWRGLHVWCEHQGAAWPWEGRQQTRWVPLLLAQLRQMVVGRSLPHRFLQGSSGFFV